MVGFMMDKLESVLITTTNLCEYLMYNTLMMSALNNAIILNGNMVKNKLQNLENIMLKKFMALFMYGFMLIKINNLNLILLTLNHFNQNYQTEDILNIQSGHIHKIYLKMELMLIILNMSINYPLQDLDGCNFYGLQFGKQEMIQIYQQFSNILQNLFVNLNNKFITN